MTQPSYDTADHPALYGTGLARSGTLPTMLYRPYGYVQDTAWDTADTAGGAGYEPYDDDTC